MRIFDQETANKQWRIKELSIRFIAGLRRIKRLEGTIAATIFAAAMCILWLLRYEITGISQITYCVDLIKLLANIAFSTIIILGSIAFCVILGTPINSKGISQNLKRIGLVNCANEAPILVRYEHRKNDYKVFEMEFYTYGIPLSVWEDKAEEIEAALNIQIDKIKPGKDKHYYIITALNGDRQLPSFIEWNPSLINPADFVLVLGESLTQQVTVDLAIIPHILIGGSTGSGKSTLLENLLTQCISKGAYVYIADFKGGVDFNADWESICTIILDEDSLLTHLASIIDELNLR